MYIIEELKGLEWKYMYESENVRDIDKIAYHLTQLQIPCRIILDDVLLIFLNGTMYQYEYWKKNYVRKPKVLERKKNEFKKKY